MEELEYGSMLNKAHPANEFLRKAFKGAKFWGSVATQLAVASLTLAAAGTAVTVMGQQQQAKAAKNQADFQAQIAQNNSIIAQRKSDDAIERGKIAAGENDVRTRQLIGRQRVAFASTGQEVDVGSALDITTDTAALGKLDSLRIINNAEREAAGFDIQANDFIAESSLRRAQGQNAISAGINRSFGTLLSGASSVSGKWSSYRADGTF